MPHEAIAELDRPAQQTQPQREPLDGGLASGYVTCKDGARLYYEVNTMAAGLPTLVIVNNYFMTAVQWRQFVGDLRTKYPVVAYDLRNQGRSSRDAGTVTFDTHVDDLKALLNGLQLKRAVLMGTCISSLIVVEFALKEPARVDKLVLVGSVMNPLGYRAHDFLHRSLLASLRRGGAEALFDHYYPLLYTARTIQAWGTPGYLVSKSRFLDNNSAEQLEQHLASSIKLKFDCERLRQVDVPTLFVSGEDDFMTRPSIVSLQVRRMARARAAYIPNAGHNPYIESPAEFQNVVYGFIKEPG